MSHQGRDRPATRSERRVSVLIMAALIVLAIALQGCTAIDIHRAPPEDWPVLQERVVPTGFVELQSMCGHTIVATVLLGYFCSAWTVVNFNDKTCTIYTATDDEHVMEHERDHCNGRDHFNASTLADGWRDWKARK